MIKNRSHFIAVITEVGKEIIVAMGIKRSVIKVAVYDTDRNLSEIDLIFSSLNQIRKATGLNVGDVIYFTGTVGECPSDNLAFFPNELHILYKNKIKEKFLTRNMILSNLLPYLKERNVVVLDGVIKVKEENQYCLIVKNHEYLRGEFSEDYHIWVNCGDSIINEGDEAIFVGDISNQKLVGDIYLKKNKEI